MNCELWSKCYENVGQWIVIDVWLVCRVDSGEALVWIEEGKKWNSSVPLIQFCCNKNVSEIETDLKLKKKCQDTKRERIVDLIGYVICTIFQTQIS